MPAWVKTGFSEYATRLPRDCPLVLTEIPTVKRGKTLTVEQVLRKEGERLRAAIPNGARVIVLDIKGRQWNTPELAERLRYWQFDGRDVALLIGGPDGLDASVKAGAETLWSLSPLTLPHPLVRIVLAEQLYRAWSILNNHPYHRA